MPKNEKIEYIEHDATVESVDASANLVTVVINDREECGSCPAATLCSGGKGDNRVTVRTPHASSYAKGEEVIIRGTDAWGVRTVTLLSPLPPEQRVAAGHEPHSSRSFITTVTRLAEASTLSTVASCSMYSIFSFFGIDSGCFVSEAASVVARPGYFLQS